MRKTKAELQQDIAVLENQVRLLVEDKTRMAQRHNKQTEMLSEKAHHYQIKYDDFVDDVYFYMGLLVLFNIVFYWFL